MAKNNGHEIAGEWNSGMLPSSEAQGKRGRPTKDWEDEINESVKRDSKDGDPHRAMTCQATMQD